MRLFFAIPLPDDVKAVLGRFQAEARGHGLAAAWVRPEGMHLTLAFLGETEPARVPGLLALAERSAGADFLLRTTRLGGFPKDRAARVVWLGLQEEPLLAEAAARLRAGLREAGIPFDGKPFRPHLTLARPRMPVDIGSLGPGPEPRAFPARELVLYQSLQVPAGTEYRALGRARYR